MLQIDPSLLLPLSQVEPESQKDGNWLPQVPLSVQLRIPGELQINVEPGGQVGWT